MNQSMIWIGEQSASTDDWSVQGDEGLFIPDVVPLKHTAGSWIPDSPKFHRPRRISRSSVGVKDTGELVTFKHEKALDALDLVTKDKRTWSLSHSSKFH